MQYAIYLNTALPIRSEAKESSEMVSQLIFGDTCQLFEEKGTFVKIKNFRDNYEGWADLRSLTIIDQSIYNDINNEPIFRTCVPIADVFCLTDKSVYHLSAGSIIPKYNTEKSSFEIGGKAFQIHPSFVSYLPTSNKDNIVPYAMTFLNTPYLWGGKNIFGIDCSGFVQVVFSLNGYALPRDASVQAKEGLELTSIEEAIPSDLLFFEKESKITHVGIYLGGNKIIHASGKVRIDSVDSKGIYNKEIDDYTHILSSIKRV